MNIVRLSVVLGGVVNERMYYSKSISMESDCATPIWGVNIYALAKDDVRNRSRLVVNIIK